MFTGAHVYFFHIFQIKTSIGILESRMMYNDVTLEVGKK